VKKRFFSKLLFSFMMVSIVPIILLGILSMSISIGISMNQLKKQVAATAVGAGETLNQLFSDFQDRLDLFCVDDELQAILLAARAGTSSDTSTSISTEAARQKIYQKIYLLLAGRTTQYEMHVISTDRSIEVSTVSVPPMYDPVRFQGWGLLRAIGQSERSIVYPNRYSASNGEEITASVGRKIIDEQTGTTLGYAIIDIPYKSIATVLGSVPTDLSISYALLDEYGYLLYDDLGVGEGLPFITSPYRSKVPSGAMESFMQQFDGQQLLASAVSLQESHLRLISAVPVDLVLRNNSHIAISTVVFALFALLLCLICSWILAKGISRPISQIVAVMEQVEHGDMTVRTRIETHDEIGELAHGLNRMIGNLDGLFRSNLEKQDRLRLAEIKHLHSQINPHFLYNTLDCVKYLAKLGMNDDIGRVISRLGILLKNSIGNKADIETVQETVRIITSYLDIQKICYPDKFEVFMDIDETLFQGTLPTLIIQPIVENAIIHGMGNKLGCCTLRIWGYRVADDLVFEISDDGVGMSQARLAEVMASESPIGDNQSIGLRNSDRRIKLYYGERYGLTIESQLGVGTSVRVVVPFSIAGKPLGNAGGKGDGSCTG